MTNLQKRFAEMEKWKEFLLAGGDSTIATTFWF